jgi:hypothetical protein
MRFLGLLNLNKAFSLLGNFSLPLGEEGAARQRRNSSWIEQNASAPTSGALLMCPFFAERPPIAVGIKGSINFQVLYHTK